MYNTQEKIEILETELSALRAEYSRQETALRNEIEELYGIKAVEDTSPDLCGGQQRLVTSPTGHHFDDYRTEPPYVITVVHPFYHRVGRFKTLYVKIEYPDGTTNNKPYEVIQRLSIWNL